MTEKVIGEKNTELFSADWLSVNPLAYSAPLQQWAAF